MVIEGSTPTQNRLALGLIQWRGRAGLEPASEMPRPQNQIVGLRIEVPGLASTSTVQARSNVCDGTRR